MKHLGALCGSKTSSALVCAWVGLAVKDGGIAKQERTQMEVGSGESVEIEVFPVHLTVRYGMGF